MKVNNLLSEQIDYDEIFSINPLIPFSDEIVEFIDNLSSEILKNVEARKYSDVITFAFWCRKSNILKLKENYTNKIRLGRGAVFHIAPSNVPINFAYSLIVGLLAGNSNIVKLSSKEFPQVDILIRIINKILLKKEFTFINKYIILLRYDNEFEITSYFSSNCNVRVIWGGDNTIQEIRKCQLSPRAFDITFADRYSLCTINANLFSCYISGDNIAKDFYNDTYLFDQNACTSPHLIVWVGKEKNIKNSKKMFWESLHKIVKERYTLNSISAIDKYTATCELAINNATTNETMGDNFIVRNTVDNLKDVDKYHCNSGFFIEYDTDSIYNITDIITDKYQTLSYYGFKKEYLKDFIIDSKLHGIDRIVPIGRTSEFSAIWDGYDLINTLSREITIEI